MTAVLRIDSGISGGIFKFRVGQMPPPSWRRRDREWGLTDGISTGYFFGIRKI